jgi:hypothetical protein
MQTPKQLKNYASVFAVATATLMPLAMAATPASADDLFFPASLCQPLNPDAAARLTFVGSSVNNISSNSNAQVTCPITNGVLIRKHRAIVRSVFNEGFTPSCSLRSFDRDGSLLEISDTTFKNNALQTGEVIPGSYHTLTCILPPGSKMLNYRLVE